MSTADLRRRAAAAPGVRSMPELLDGFRDNDLLTYASAIAFQVLTSLVPLGLCLLGLTGLLHLDAVWRDDVRPSVVGSVSADARGVIDATVANVLGSKQLFWVTGGAVLALWQVSGAVRAAMGVLNRVYCTPEERSFGHRYGLSLALGGGLSLVFLAAIGAVTLTPLLIGDTGPALSAAVLLVRWGAAGALLFAGVWALVRLGPDRPQPLGWTSVGAGFVIAAWLAMSALFLVYLTGVASYASLFGSLATVVVLMGYLYATAVVFVTGIQLDAMVRRDRLEAGHAAHPDTSTRQRPGADGPAPGTSRP